MGWEGEAGAGPRGPSLGEVTQVSAGWWESPACILDSSQCWTDFAGSTIVPESIQLSGSVEEMSLHTMSSSLRSTRDH